MNVLAYNNGPGSMGVPLICFFSFLTGMGSCSAFSAAIKTCTYPTYPLRYASSLRRSCIKLPESPWNSYSIPPVGLRSKRVLLLRHFLFCVPRQYLRFSPLTCCWHIWHGLHLHVLSSGHPTYIVVFQGTQPREARPFRLQSAIPYQIRREQMQWRVLVGRTR